MSLFIAVADGGGMTRAGDLLGLSPAVVSKRIANLESRLGARLLNRTTRRVTLTDEGRMYLERCRTIVEQIEDVEGALRGRQSEPRGVLRVTAPASFGRSHVSPWVPEFLAAYPSVELHLHLSDKIVDIVEEGVDVAVRIGGLRDSSLVARWLAPNRRVVCASPDYLRAHGRPQRPEDLAEHDCLVFNPSRASHQHWRFKGPRGEQAVRVHGRLVCDIGEVLRDSAIAGIGIAMISIWVVAEDLRAGRLLPVLEDFPLSDADIHAVYPHRRGLSPKVRVWIEHLAQKYGPVPYWEHPC